MVRFRCPKCGVETEVTAKHGGEVVALYCLRHTSGLGNHMLPVNMDRMEAPVPGPGPQLNYAVAGAGMQ